MTTLPASHLLAPATGAHATPSAAPGASARGPAPFQKALEERMEEPRATASPALDGSGEPRRGERAEGDECPSGPGVHGRGRGKPRTAPDTTPDADSCALAAQLALLEPHTHGKPAAGGDPWNGNAAGLDLLRPESAQAVPEGTADTSVPTGVPLAAGATVGESLASASTELAPGQHAPGRHFGSGANHGEPMAGVLDAQKLSSPRRALAAQALTAGPATAHARSSDPARHEAGEIPSLGEGSRETAHADTPPASAVDAAPVPDPGGALPDTTSVAAGAPASMQPGFALTSQASDLVQAAPADPAQGTHTATLQPRVGTRAWEQALGEQLVHLHQFQQGSAELQLNPAGLGPLQIQLEMKGDQVHALFLAQPQAVRAAVEAALPQLREALAQQGLALGQAQVGTGGGSSGNFHQPHPDQEHRPAPWRPSPPGPLTVGTSPAPGPAVPTGRLHTWA